MTPDEIYQIARDTACKLGHKHMQYLLDARLQGRKEYVVPPEALVADKTEGESASPQTRPPPSPSRSPAKELNMYQPTTI